MISASTLLETSHHILKLDYDILAVAKEIGISHRKAKQIAIQVQECTMEELREYIQYYY